MKEILRIFLIPIAIGILSAYVAFKAHVATADIHMPLKEKLELFVGRKEQNAINKNILTQLKEIKEMIKDMRE